MDNSIIPALSAILGTTVGSLITFLTTFLNRRFAMRRDILARDVANREQLYSEFLKDASSYLLLIRLFQQATTYWGRPSAGSFGMSFAPRISS